MIHQCRFCTYKTPMLSSLKAHLARKNKCYDYEKIFVKEDSDLSKANKKLIEENFLLNQEIDFGVAACQKLEKKIHHRDRIITSLRKRRQE